MPTRLRLRLPTGQTTVEATTFGELATSITAALDGNNKWEVLSGYPPAILTWPASQEPLEPKLRSGETIVVRASAVASAPTTLEPSLVSAPASLPSCQVAASAPVATGAGGEQFLRRVIPADNSCLFNAVAHALEGGCKDRASTLRKVVADAVLADGERFCEAVLGQPPKEYAEWIQDAAHWGGGIELAVLAEHFNTELAAFDIQSQRVDTFGSTNGYSQRAFLLYDGIHYDALVKVTRVERSLLAGACPTRSTSPLIILHPSSYSVFSWHAHHRCSAQVCLRSSTSRSLTWTMRRQWPAHGPLSLSSTLRESSPTRHSLRSVASCVSGGSRERRRHSHTLKRPATPTSQSTSRCDVYVTSGRGGVHGPLCMLPCFNVGCCVARQFNGSVHARGTAATGSGTPLCPVPSPGTSTRRLIQYYEYRYRSYSYSTVYRIRYHYLYNYKVWKL